MFGSPNEPNSGSRRETKPRHFGEVGETASIGGLFRVPRVLRTRAGQHAAVGMLGSPNEPISRAFAKRTHGILRKPGKACGWRGSFFRHWSREPTFDGPSGTGSENPWHPRLGLGPLERAASIPRETNPRHSGEAGETASIGGPFRMTPVRRTRAGQAVAVGMLGSPNEPISSSDCETNPRHVAEARQNLRIGGGGGGGGGGLSSVIGYEALSLDGSSSTGSENPWHPRLGLGPLKSPPQSRAKRTHDILAKPGKLLRLEVFFGCHGFVEPVPGRLRPSGCSVPRTNPFRVVPRETNPRQDVPARRNEPKFARRSRNEPTVRWNLLTKRTQ